MDTKIKIKKLGHCCLLIKAKNIRILTDPGTYSTAQDELTGIDIILISHEHGDHFHIDSVKRVLKNNPNAKIITNHAVSALLAAEGIDSKILVEGGRDDSHGILIEAYGTEHAEIYGSWGRVENTGYFIASRLFYPGDAFTNPKRPVDILALPVAGPWMKISEAINYALAVKPKIIFPVHDGILKHSGMMHGVFSKLLTQDGMEFIPMTEGDEKEF